jgi:hypothetical protein
MYITPRDAIPSKVHYSEGYFATCADKACIISSVPRAHLPSWPSSTAAAFELKRKGAVALPASANGIERPQETANYADWPNFARVYRSRPRTVRCEAQSRGTERNEQLQPTASTCLHP